MVSTIHYIQRVAKVEICKEIRSVHGKDRRGKSDCIFPFFLALGSTFHSLKKAFILACKNILPLPWAELSCWPHTHGRDNLPGTFASMKKNCERFTPSERNGVCIGRQKNRVGRKYCDFYLLSTFTSCNLQLFSFLPGKQL